MARDDVYLTGKEITFAENDIIVSKTDDKGRLTYVNDIFLQISGYTEAECIGQPHSMIRHPHMPRSVFKLLWDTIQGGEEIFAYVNNRAKNGDNYWVLAHVTPSFDDSGRTIGYHSNRRVPTRSALKAIGPIYDALLAEERRHGDDRKAGMAAATNLLLETLKKGGKRYDEFVLGL